MSSSPATSQLRLQDEVRYFFYVTNTPKGRFSTREVVFEANDRCDQERLIGELNHGVHALRTPSNGLDSNGAWLLIASLAWNLKAWLAICMPRRLQKEGREILRMEFRRFLHSIMLLPCQVVKTARQTVVRLLAYGRAALGCRRTTPTDDRRDEARGQAARRRRRIGSR